MIAPKFALLRLPDLVAVSWFVFHLRLKPDNVVIPNPIMGFTRVVSIPYGRMKRGLIIH